MADATLTWDDLNSGLAQEDSFKVYRSTSAMTIGALPAAIASLPADTEAYTDTGLASGEHFYLVSAKIGSLEEFSSQKSITIGGGVPVIPPYPAAMAASTHRLVLPYNSYVNIPAAPDLNPATNITVEWRGTLGTNSGNGVLVEKPYTSHSAPHYQYAIIAKPTYIRFDLVVGGVRIETPCTGLTELVANARAVISATYDGAEIVVYLNGRIVGTTAIVGALANYATDLRFSGHVNVTTERVTNAGYEEVRIWETARTQKEIILNMDRNLAGGEAGLVGLWDFNEGSGAVVADQTANGNDGAVTGAVTWSTVTHTYDGVNDDKWHFPARIDLPTYDGSGEMVHPSVIHVDGGLGGYPWWMAMTPYAASDAQLENPSILASSDGVNWVVPAGVTNPLIASPAGASDYNSDPCLLLANGGAPTLWMYYRETVAGVDNIYRVTSADGVSWSAPVLIWSNVAALSPWIFWSGSEYVALMVDHPALTISRRTSADGLTWSASTSVALSGVPATRFPWHLEGVKDPTSSRYHIMLCSSTGAGGANARLHYAYSDDAGASITVVDYLMVDTYGDITNEYKSSIVPDPDFADRYWVYGAHRNSANEWWPSLALRKYSGTELVQEQALP